MIVRPAFHPGLSIIEPDTGGGLIVDAIQRYRQSEPPRTGVHCSTIVNDILRRMYPSKYGREIEEQSSLGYQEIGNIIEDVVADRLRERMPGWVKPEPRCYRGLWCSPDGWLERTKTIDEIKATWVSDRDFLDSVKFMGYVFQTLEYALAWGADRIRLHVLFVGGSYGYQPRPRSFVIRWDRHRVLTDHDKMLRQHAKDMGLVLGR